MFYILLAFITHTVTVCKAAQSAIIIIHPKLSRTIPALRCFDVAKVLPLLLCTGDLLFQFLNLFRYSVYTSGWIYHIV